MKKLQHEEVPNKNIIEPVKRDQLLPAMLNVVYILLMTVSPRSI